MQTVSENETVEDIAKMMRRNEEVFHHLYWCEYADRIEAAHKREVAELRECLEQAYGDKIGTYTMKGNEVERWHKALKGASNEGK